ncbi:MAG: DoxX family protein [Devosiaceae bacterium]|nr:DoxX family protein [Devosiaceae bacterium]
MQKLINLVKWVNNLLSQFPLFILAFGARIFVGLQFFRSGSLKFDGWFSVSDTTFYLFKNDFSGVPLPPVMGAYMAAYGEIILATLLIVGLGARFSALGLLVMTIVIQTFVFPEAYILHGLWAVSLIYIIKYGGGMLSVDYFIKKK